MNRQKTFKLVRPTLALDVVDGKQRAVTIPADAILLASSGTPSQSGLVTVNWEDRSLQMFAIDLLNRAIDITSQTKGSGPSGLEPLPSSPDFGEWTG